MSSGAGEIGLAFGSASGLALAAPACELLALALGSFFGPDGHDVSVWSPLELRASLWRLSQ